MYGFGFCVLKWGFHCVDRAGFELIEICLPLPWEVLGLSCEP